MPNLKNKHLNNKMETFFYNFQLMYKKRKLKNIILSWHFNLKSVATNQMVISRAAEILKHHLSESS